MNNKAFWSGVCLFLFLTSTGCAPEPLPGELAPFVPQQDEGDDGETFEQQGFKITPLATYDIEARVLSIKSYNDSEQDNLAPLDFALGWGEMSDPLVYEELDIRQGHRWYNYSWGSKGPPIPLSSIIKQSANVHLIPKNDEIKDQLFDVNEGEVIRLKGRLVAVQQGHFHWRSSLSRKDSGNGACELMYVEEIKRLY